MKIMKCPHCQSPVVLDFEGQNLQEIICCAECGFVDYAYSFNLTRNSYRPNNMNMSVIDVIQVLKEQLQMRDYNHIKFDELIYDLHNQCRALSPLMLGELINTLVDSKEQNIGNYNNDSMFVIFEPEQVSLDDIFKKISEVYPSQPSVNQKNNEKLQKEYDNTISQMKKTINNLSEEVRCWEKEYTDLKNENQCLKMENATLKIKNKSVKINTKI